MGTPETSTELIQLTRDMYDAWNDEGWEVAAADYWAGDVVMRDSADIPDAGTFRGFEDVKQRVREMIELWGEWTCDLQQIVPRGDTVVVSFRGEGRGRDGLRFSQDWVHVVRWSGGRVSEIRSFSRPEYARRAGWID